MKKILIYSTLGILALFGIQACNPEDFLDTTSHGITDASFICNDSTAMYLLPGVYDPAGWMSYSQYLEWAIGDVTSDDAVKGGGGDNDQPEIYAIEHFQATDETTILNTVWCNLYVGINRANKLIEGVEGNSKVSAGMQKRLIAESKFLRAYYNFNLVKVFGRIPIVDHILTPSEYTNPRNTMEECWAAIEKDLKDAMADLPLKSEMPSKDLGRATWGSAAALLTKAYIFEEKWAEADALATEIIASKEYRLQPNYGDLFLISTDNGMESVFDIQKKVFPAISTLWGDDAEASTIEIYQRTRWDNLGWGFDQPTQNLYNEFEPGDIRRKWTIISDGDTLWKGTADEEIVYTRWDAVHNPDAVTGYNKRKGTIPASQRGTRDDQSPLNIREIRYAEVFLWQAEARAHTGGDWQSPVDSVRNRVGLGASPYINGLTAVYHERRVELGMESQRYWDLVRTGRGNLISGYTDSKRYLPIPLVQTQLNPNLEHNPY
jgi:starch-binding outer membrane protein, SusD/RagB family